MDLDTLLAAAFKAGWQERNRLPGLKRQVKRNLNNAILGAIGGGRYSEVEYVPDTRKYHRSIWLNSAFRHDLRDRDGSGEAGQTAKQAGPEGRQPGPKASPQPLQNPRKSP